jgi:AcrR family transcriptional regulator
MADAEGQQSPRGQARAPRGHTREQICEVALELFAEQGYDKTSLREIAERLGLTKAALYYHFQSKEEIVGAIVENYLDEVDDLIAWARQRPSTRETRHELLRRYSEVVATHVGSMRFFQQNPGGVRTSETGARFRDRMTTLHGLLHDPDDPLLVRLRAFLAIVGQHIAQGGLDEAEPDSEVRRQAALQVGLELLDWSERTADG